MYIRYEMDYLPTDAVTWLLVALSLPTVTYISLYVLSNLRMYLAGPQDLKKKYKATWALVTGAGTGIGSKST